ncbi:hypothetical protein V6N11_053981 [Hibiscus sabdariffa]|uniref:Uncharacterized protein n=1 Tax=Hibiscus sabdariffa TaxID=183260 RepID=A0ABR2S2H2_9ROSI
MVAALPPPPSSLKLTTTAPFPSPRALFHALHKRQISFIPRATPDSDSDADSPTETDSSSTASADSDPFESRLSKVRLRYRIGAGKKAERRKAKKTGSVSTSSSSSIYLPPVPLKEPVSNGLKVDFGFSPYSERINGRIAILGFTALVLVELATVMNCSFMRCSNQVRHVMLSGATLLSNQHCRCHFVSGCSAVFLDRQFQAYLDAAEEDYNLLCIRSRNGVLVCRRSLRRSSDQLQFHEKQQQDSDGVIVLLEPVFLSDASDEPSAEPQSKVFENRNSDDRPKATLLIKDESSFAAYLEGETVTGACCCLKMIRTLITFLKLCCYDQNNDNFSEADAVVDDGQNSDNFPEERNVVVEDDWNPDNFLEVYAVVEW